MASRPGEPYSTELPEMPSSDRMFQWDGVPSNLRVKCEAAMLTVAVGSPTSQLVGRGVDESVSVAVRGISKTCRSRGAEDMMPAHLPSSRAL